MTERSLRDAGIHALVCGQRNLRALGYSKATIHRMLDAAWNSENVVRRFGPRTAPPDDWQRVNKFALGGKS
jgi:hypothetical protein